MILLERSTGIVFSVHFLLSLKKLILHDWEKDYTRLGWCSVSWQTDENHDKKYSMQQVLFHLSRSMGSIKIFSLKK